MTETDKAYIAGLIDGEGCIGLTYCKSSKLYKKTGRREYHYYRPQVSVGMNKKECILFLLRFVKGTYCKGQRSPNSTYYWTRIFSQDQINYLLKMILPYLLIKKEQAQNLLAWIEYRKGKNREINREGRYLSNYGEKDRTFYQTSRTLNKKRSKAV